MRKVYDEKFKEEAVKYYLDCGKSLEEASNSLNIGKSTLFKWVQVYKSGSEYKENITAKKKAISDADKKRIRELEKENAELMEVNKLLKKSMAIFCRDLDNATNSSRK